MSAHHAIGPASVLDGGTTGQAHATRHTGSLGLHDGIIDELTFLAAWNGGITTSLNAYIRVRQLHRAHPGLGLQPTPPPKLERPSRKKAARRAAEAG